MRELIQLDIVKQILTEYNDAIPVHLFLKDFYKKHRQFGSRDRRFYSNIVYTYFRCKTLFTKLPFEEKLFYSGFLLNAQSNEFYSYLQRIQQQKLPDEVPWNSEIGTKLLSLENTGKISFSDYFPGAEAIDTPIDKAPFFLSHFTQPDFFIRVSVNRVDEITQQLKAQGIIFSKEENCFAFESQIDLSKYLPIGSYEVQDFSSQQTISLFEPKGNEIVWDFCSGAGGKSLMLLDTFPELKIYCSDKRPGVLENLKERFSYKASKPSGIQVFDVVKNRGGLVFNSEVIPDAFFDVIVADVPCSGSGTWGRNPERLYQFKATEIAVYSEIQKSVIENSLRYLKPGGLLVYITCSVYADENTKNVRSFEAFGLNLQQEKYFIGYDKHADTMYGAVLVKV